MLPGAPTGEALKGSIPRPDFVAADKLLGPAYKKLRAEADSWQATRTAFMMARLKQGRHPDTDPTFWNGYKEAPAPSLPSQSVPDAFKAYMAYRQRFAVALFVIVPVLCIAAIASVSAILRRRSRSIREKGSGMFLGSVTDRQIRSDEL